MRTILEMVQLTRLDCVSGSAGLMRQALAQAAHHVAHRLLRHQMLVGPGLAGRESRSIDVGPIDLEAEPAQRCEELVARERLTPGGKDVHHHEFLHRGGRHIHARCLQ